MKTFFKKIGNYIKRNKTARYVLCFMALLAVFSLSFILFSKEEKPEDFDDNTAIATPEEPDNNETPEPEDVDFSELTYIAFGDSITYGYVPGSSQPMSNPYPKLVSNELGLKGYKNQGFCGILLSRYQTDIYRSVSDVIASTDLSNYDIISLLCGVNDYANSAPLGTSEDTAPDTIYGALDTIGRQLSNLENKFVFFMTPYKVLIGENDWLTPNDAGYTLADVVTAVNVVAARYNIPVLDMYNDGNFEVEMYTAQSDGCHPTQEFITNYTAPQIVEFIKENYKK